MKKQLINLFVVVILALLDPLAQKGRGDFILWDNQEITVNSHHNQGNLYDTSRAFIIPGGSVTTLRAENFSDVGISGGSVTDFFAEDFSRVDVFDGYVYLLVGYDSSTLDISGGHVDSISTYQSSVVDITGGIVDWLQAAHSVAVDISGGSFDSLRALQSSTVRFYGQNFSVSGGLILDGSRVLGTGMLSGEWMDGTPWAINIYVNEPTANILAVPVPSAVILGCLGLTFSGWLLRKRKTILIDTEDTEK